MCIFAKKQAKLLKCSFSVNLCELCASVLNKILKNNKISTETQRAQRFTEEKKNRKDERKFVYSSEY